MIQVLKSQLLSNQLLKEIEGIHFWKDGSGAEMSVNQSGGLPFKSPLLYLAIQEIGKLRNQLPLHMMINRLAPKVTVPKHTDTLKPTQQGEHPRLERWHLPIITSYHCGWWDEDNGIVPMMPGFWYGPVPYWREHYVWNHGTIERIHLIIDLDTPERL